MADPFLAEIRIFPFSFAPTGWATCDGQVLPISQSTALFSLLGTNYGGNGTSTFGLPNLAGSVPMHPGQGAGFSPHYLGEASGTASVTLQASELPAHGHTLMAKGTPPPANGGAPSPTSGLGRSSGATAYTAAANLAAMNPAVLQTAGGGGPHNNLMPYLTLTFCIALQGIYPQRS